MEIKLKVNFVMVGAPKCGTTSIAKYLDQHPDICFAREKEPFYFIPDAVSKINAKDPMYEVISKKAHLSVESYRSLFERGDKQKAKLFGDGTVHYFYHYEEATKNIKSQVGDVPIIVILRNPVDRAYSNYLYQKRLQLDSFEKALGKEDSRRSAGYNSFWFYKEVGLYYNPVRHYKANFSKVFVGFYDDFCKAPEVFLSEVTGFLGADASYRYDISARYNETAVPKSIFFHYVVYAKKKLFGNRRMFPELIMSLLARFSRGKQRHGMAPTTALDLLEFYKSDIEKLESLLNEDLSRWKKNEY